MGGLKTILSLTVMFAGMAFASVASAQVMINIGIPPTCAYGYYDYAPYDCSPMGYYGPGYFYNGIFLGMGPWAGWGYGHGWGGHRFVSEGGGSYHGGGGEIANRSNYARGGGQQAPRGGVHASTARVSTTHNTVSNHGATNAGGPRPGAGHAAPSRGGGASHGSPAGGGGGRTSGGGGGHAGGGGGGGHAGGGGEHR